MTTRHARIKAPLHRARSSLAAWRDIPGQARTVIAAAFADSIGAGLYLTGSSVYFVHSVHLSADKVAIGQAVTALAGLAVGVPAGKLADRVGPRNVTATLVLLSVPGLAVLTQVRSFWAFLPAAVAAGVPMIAAEVTRGALVAQVAGQDGAARLAIYARSAFNAGFSAGLLGAGVVIAIGSRTAYLSLFAGEGATNIVNCLLLLRLPQEKPRSPSPAAERATRALGDVPYMLVAQVSGMTRLGDVILTLGLPLWIVTRTTAPRELAAWLLIGNTALVVLFQARVTRRAGTTAGAMLIQRWAFAALALACLIAGFSAHLKAAAATTWILIGATGLLTLGEMWGEGAWWSLRYNLASPSAQGAYGAAFALGQAVPSVLGPVLVTALAIDLGLSGWFVLAALFLVCGTISRWPVAWAIRQQPAAAPNLSAADPNGATPASASKQPAG